MVIKVKKYWIYVNFILLFYVLLFQPPIIDKYIIVILQVVHFSLLCIIRKNCLKEFIKYFRIELRILFLLIVYVILRDLFSGELVYADRFLAWSFQGFLYSFVLIYSYNFLKIKYELRLSIIDLLFIVSVIAGLLSLLLILNPTLDSFYASISKMDQLEFYERYNVRHRYYGVSDSLGYGYSYVMGFFAGYSSLLLLKGELKYIVTFVLSLIAVWFNARIGFVAILIFIFYSLLFIKIKIKNVIRLSLLVLVLYGVFVYFKLDQFFFNFEWVSAFFYEFSDILLGTNYLQGDTTSSVLFGDFIIWPETFSQWIFGRGESLFLKKGMNSDNGFILQLNYGGLIIMILLFTLILLMVRRIRQTLSYKHYFLWFFIGTVILANSKGFLFASTPIGRILPFLYVMYIYQSVKNINKYVSIQ